MVLENRPEPLESIIVIELIEISSLKSSNMSTFQSFTRTVSTKSSINYVFSCFLLNRLRLSKHSLDECKLPIKIFLIYL